MAYHVEGGGDFFFLIRNLVAFYFIIWTIFLYCSWLVQAGGAGSGGGLQMNYSMCCTILYFLLVEKYNLLDKRILQFPVKRFS